MWLITVKSVSPLVLAYHAQRSCADDSLEDQKNDMIIPWEVGLTRCRT